MDKTTGIVGVVGITVLAGLKLILDHLETTDFGPPEDGTFTIRGPFGFEVTFGKKRKKETDKRYKSVI